MKRRTQKEMRARLDQLRNRLIGRTGVTDDRKVILYQVLVELDGPVSRQDLLDLLGWGEYELPGGALSPLSQLVDEGLVDYIEPFMDGTRRRYYYADPDLTMSLLPRRYRNALDDLFVEIPSSDETKEDHQ